jgi:hypothetical protein
MPVLKLPSLYLALGPGAFSGQIFAHLCDQLLIRDAEAGAVEFWSPSDRVGDYRGLDAFAEVVHPHDPSVFSAFRGRVGLQYKFYPSESRQLNSRQKSEIKKSLREAADKNPGLAAWILVTPEDFDTHQLHWLMSLPEALEAEDRDNPERRDPPRKVPPVLHWGQKKLHSLILKYPECAVHLFPSLGDPRPVHNWRRYCAELALSDRTDALVPLHSTHGEDLRILLEDFVASDEKRLLCVLGSYGAGKTTSLQQFSIELARRHTSDEGIIPIFVRLRYVRGGRSFQHNLVEYLSREYGLGLDVLSLRTELGKGRLLLVFDGLDEKEEISERGAARIRLAEVFDFLAPGSKMIVSSRTEFFLDALDERTALLPERKEILGLRRWDDDARVAEANDGAAQVVYIAPIAHDQARQYLSDTVGEPFSAVEDALWAAYDVKDLIKTPLFLNLVAATIPELIAAEKTGEGISVIDLYEFYVRSKLEQDVLSGRIGPNLRTRLAAIEDLAERMLNFSTPRLHFSHLDQDLLTGLGTTERDFLSTAFLTRDGAGYYEFSHRSFLEYFGARRMKRSLRGEAGNCLRALLPLSSRLQLIYFEEMIAQEMRRSRGRRAEDSRRAAAPVRLDEFCRFVETAGYTPLAEPLDILGFAGVTYFDAVAYAMSSAAALPDAAELYPLLKATALDNTAGRHDERFYFGSEGSALDPSRGTAVKSLSSGLQVVLGVPEWCMDRVLLSGESTDLQGPRRLLKAEVSLTAAAETRYVFRIVGAP